MQRLSRAALAAFAVFVAAACTPSPNKNAAPPPPVPAAPAAPTAPSQPANPGTAPVAAHGGSEARLKKADGSTFTVAEIPGKAKVVNFWATWCAPCIGEMPILNAMSKKYASKDVSFVAVSVDENGPADVEPFLKRGRVKIEFPVAYASFDDVAPLDVAPPIPDTLVFDGKGRLVKHFDKIIEQKELEDAIAEALSNAGK